MKGTTLFEHMPHNPAVHLKLYFYAAVLHIIERASHSFASFEELLEGFPFLVDYNNELAGHGLEGLSRDEANSLWRDSLRAWEEHTAVHLPLRALGEEAGLDYEALTMLMAIGVLEDEPRFGQLFDAMQGGTGQRRPTVGLLTGWWSDMLPDTTVRAVIRRLLDLGLVTVVNPEAPRAEWALQFPVVFWDALRGDVHEAPLPWVSYQPMHKLVLVRDLILSDDVRKIAAAVPALLSSGDVRVLLVRGPRNNGRSTLLGGMAAALELGMLTVTGLSGKGDERWQLIGPLATLTHAMPVIIVDPGPGETAEIPALHAYSGPLGIALGKQGGVNGPGVERALTLELKLPGMAERKMHWAAALPAQSQDGLDIISERFRMTSGTIRRAAQLAGACAALEGKSGITPADVQQASRGFNRQVLDTLATRIESSGDWSNLAAGDETFSELQSLEMRCRHREALMHSTGSAAGGTNNAGVRALFSGPSGTGKTFAARLLASVLQKDLYRLDLSTVVNKYIGETEKNLDQIFSHAEELDIILLLDEGDALLTQRTSVQSSNDRYANMETNFLLQRIEAFEGILIVTSNAADRIDSAFKRRFDLVVDFRQPDVEERWAIWQSHLPAKHAVDAALLASIAGYCVLSGGQIRNVVQHASLLALHDSAVITPAHLQAALLREYRKMGAVCPLFQSNNVH